MVTVSTGRGGFSVREGDNAVKTAIKNEIKTKRGADMKMKKIISALTAAVMIMIFAAG